jgi:hypothetical protein
MGKTIQAFVDDAGRVKRWPKKKAEKLVVLEYLQGKILRSKEYTETEINTLLDEWHLFHDFALLRRELYDNFLVDRTPDCRKYWISEEK